MSWKKSSFSAAHFSNSGKRTKKWSRTSRFTGAIAGVLSRAFGAVGDEGATSGPHLRPSLIPLSAPAFSGKTTYLLLTYSLFCRHKTTYSLFCWHKTTYSLFCWQSNLFAILLAQNNLFAILLAKKPIRYCAGKTTYSLFCWQNNLFAILLATYSLFCWPFNRCKEKLRLWKKTLRNVQFLAGE